MYAPPIYLSIIKKLAGSKYIFYIGPTFYELNKFHGFNCATDEDKKGGMGG